MLLTVRQALPATEAEGKGPKTKQFVVSVSFESLSFFCTMNVM
jgi:hypothetical protein